MHIKGWPYRSLDETCQLMSTPTKVFRPLLKASTYRVFWEESRNQTAWEHLPENMTEFQDKAVDKDMYKRNGFVRLRKEYVQEMKERKREEEGNESKRQRRGAEKFSKR